MKRTFKPADFVSAVRKTLAAEPMLYVEYRGGVGLSPGAFIVWQRQSARPQQAWGCVFWNADDRSLSEGRHNITRSECLRAVAEWAGTPLKETAFLAVRD